MYTHLITSYAATTTTRKTGWPTVKKYADPKDIFRLGAMIHHTRQRNPQQILGCIPGRRGVQENTQYSPLQAVPDGQKGNNTDSMPFRFHSCERRAGFSRHRKWRPQLAPLPPLPHPPLRDSGTGTSMQEDQRDLWRLQSNISKNTAVSRPTFTDDHTDKEEHREGDTGKSSKMRGTHLPFFPLRSWLASLPEYCCHRIIRFHSEERGTITVKPHCDAGRAFLYT